MATRDELYNQLNELWEQFQENHIQDVLSDHSSTEAITPVSCKVCGRLLRYQSTLNDKAWRN